MVVSRLDGSASERKDEPLALDAGGDCHAGVVCGSARVRAFEDVDVGRRGADWDQKRGGERANETTNQPTNQDREERERVGL